MRKLFTYAAALASIGAVAAAQSGYAAEGRGFTVRDDIERTRILNASDGYGYGLERDVANFSPDGRKFVVRVGQPSIDRNVVDETLLVYDSAEVEASLAAREHARVPHRKLVTLSADREERMISSMKWVDASHFTYLGVGANGKKQLFRANVNTGKIEQLTQHPTDVLTTDVAGHAVLYLAAVPEEHPRAVAVREEWLGDLFRSQPPLPIVEVFKADLRTGVFEKIDGSKFALSTQYHFLSVSPSGRYAVIRVPAVNAPSHWIDYQGRNNNFFGWLPDRVSSDPTSIKLQLYHRFALVDLHARTMRPLMDAPSGLLAENYTPTVAHWLDDERRVLLSSSFVPLSEVSPDEREKRRRGTAIAEIEIASGKADVILWEPWHEDGKKFDAIAAIDWSAATGRLDIEYESGAKRALRRSDKGWTQTKPRAASSQTRRFTIALKQDLNTRPSLVVRGGKCKCERTLFDPTPHFADASFGRIEEITWTDANAVAWKGALIYPVGYRAGERYPAVIQTHGYNPNTFYFAGPSDEYAGIGTSAYAAQPLANLGFLVLQIEDKSMRELKEKAGSQTEPEQYAAGYLAAAETLIERGLADPGRIGIMGFSRTGTGVTEALAQSPTTFAAALLSDASITGLYMGRLMMVTMTPDHRAQRDAAETAGGFPPPLDAKARERWMQQGTVYRLDPNRTPPIRFEAMHPSGVVAFWEPFAVLRYSGRPVDLVYYPDGVHVLFEPQQRLESQGGAVDWWRFWLKGEEDLDSAKEAQYERWRELRSVSTAQ